MYIERRPQGHLYDLPRFRECILTDVHNGPPSLSDGGDRPQPRQLSILERRKRVARHYLVGLTQWEIAHKEGVDQSTISRDLEAIRVEWGNSTLADYHERLVLELARIDEIERQAWAGWQSSRLVARVESTEDGETPGGGMRKQKVMRKGRDGNPQFLTQIQWCVQTRIKLLILDPEVRKRLGLPLGALEKADPYTVDSTTPEGELASALIVKRMEKYGRLYDRLAAEQERAGPPPGGDNPGQPLDS